ncbi:MAG: TatD family hydrolase, partial [Promethearchaeota archaeon]
KLQYIFMFNQGSKTTKGGHYRIDLMHTIYRTIGDLKMFRHIGLRDIISSVIVPFKLSGAKSYHDFFEWFLKDVERCKRFNINAHPVVGIPPALNIPPKTVDETLMYVEQYIREKKIIGIGELGIGTATKEEYQIMKRQFELAAKYDIPVIVSAPKYDKIANTSIILKELKRSKIERAIIDHCDEETLQLVLRSHNENIKAALTVGHQALSAKEALEIYYNYSYDTRICLDSGLGLKESSLFGLINTIELFEESVHETILQRLCYLNYLDVFPTISPHIRTTW